MWLPAIVNMASRDGWAVRPIVKSGCAPAHWYIQQVQIARCSAWYSWAVSQAEHLRPTVVMIAGDYGALSEQDAAQVAAGIGTLAKAMTPYVTRVIVIADQPPQIKQPVDCLLSSGANMAQCSTTLTAAELQIRAAMRSVAVSVGAGYMDTSGWFCADEICPMVIGHDIVYTDGNHISATYARRLSDAFASAFNAATARTIPHVGASSTPR
jgi:hypothetical protein